MEQISDQRAPEWKDNHGKEARLAPMYHLRCSFATGGPTLFPWGQQWLKPECESQISQAMKTNLKVEDYHFR